MISKRLLTSTLILFVLSACASATGNGSARLIAKNSLEVGLSPFYLVDHSATNADHAWHLTRSVSAGKPIAGFLKPNQMLRDAFTGAIFNLPGFREKASSLDETRDFASECGGSYSTHTKIAADGRLTGTITFSDFADDCSLALSGRVPFTGTLDRITGDLNAELALSQLIGHLDESRWQLDGELSLSFNIFKGDNQVFSGESDLAVADETGTRFQLEDVDFKWDHTGVYQTVVLHGQIHFEKLGTVRVETASPIQISNTPGRINSISPGASQRPAGDKARTSHSRRLPFDGALLFHGANDSKVRLLFSKPGFPGFFWIDGSDGLQTMGTL